MTLQAWAERWGVPPQALAELALPTDPTTPPTATGGEAAVLSTVRLEASQAGCRLWRNNCGVATAADGRVVRYGLCNDSKQLNSHVKSCDLVGVRPVVVQPQHVGTTLGVFLARECKRPGWYFRGTPEEMAQRSFINLVNSMGGDAAFATGAGTI
jgi:hypothetical protein